MTRVINTMSEESKKECSCICHGKCLIEVAEVLLNQRGEIDGRCHCTKPPCIHCHHPDQKPRVENGDDIILHPFNLYPPQEPTPHPEPVGMESMEERFDKQFWYDVSNLTLRKRDTPVYDDDDSFIGYNQNAAAVPDDVKKFCRSEILRAREDERKAFGGCTNCYGKGYATTIEFASRRGISTQLPVMRFCDCDRGKQLQSLVEATPTNTEQ